MIKEILQLIVEEKILDKKDIAKRMGIQVETLDDIIRLLIQRGFLRSEDEGCDDATSCSGCHLSDGCDTVTSVGSVFYVTDKGRAYAQMSGGNR